MPAIDYTPPPTVKLFMQSRAFVRGIVGPYGSGKSTGCVMDLAYQATLQTPAADGVRYTRFVIIRNTNRMLEDTTIRTVHEWLPPGVAGTWLSTKRNFTLQFGDVHSEWWFRALDNPDDVKNLLSMEMTGAWINEFREVHPSILTNIIGRVGRYRGPGKIPCRRPGVIMDSNPPPLDGYYYNLFEKEPPEEIAVIARTTGRPMVEVFKQPSGLSPQAENIEHLPDSYYELMVAGAINDGRGEEWIKVHVHGQYGLMVEGEPVYRGFNHAVHVSPAPLTPIPGKKISIGMDFGLTPAACFLQQNAKGQWLVLAELTTPEKETMGIERFCETKLLPFVKANFPDHDDFEILADPAGNHRSQSNEQTCFQVLRAFGFQVRPGPQAREVRIGSVQRVLSRMIDGEAGILYDPSCKMLLRAKQGAYHYRHKKTVTAELVEEPVKNDVSHVSDAEQYVLGAYEGPAMRGQTPRKWGGKALPPVVRPPSKWRVYA